MGEGVLLSGDNRSVAEAIAAQVGIGTVLAVADIGIAIGSGSDEAKEAGDILLLRDDVRDVVTALGLSRATMARIRQNLFWAFIYNSLGVPIAALGWLNPMIAGADGPEFAVGDRQLLAAAPLPGARGQHTRPWWRTGRLRVVNEARRKRL